MPAHQPGAPRLRLLTPFVCRQRPSSAGPGTHNTPLHQLRDSATKSRGVGSSAFASTTARFRDESPRTPAPGAYNPARKFAATQRYSSQPLL